MHLFRTFFAFLTAAVVLVLVVPILIGLGVFKTVSTLTILCARYFEPHFVTWQEIIEFHPVVGWKPKPNLNTRALVEDLFHFRTDADGWRGSTRLNDSEIIIFGDSHAFGYGMDEKDFFANLDPWLRVKSLGVDGYNMVQEVLWMRQLSTQLKNKLVVWLVFLGNDLADNLEPAQYHYRMPFVSEVKEGSKWQIVTHHLSPAPWSFVPRRHRETNYDRLIKIYSPTFVSERAFAACEYLIDEASSVCDRVGANLTVLTVPDPMTLSQAGLEVLYKHGADPASFDPALPDRRIRSICGKLMLPFLAGTDYFKRCDYKEHDSHWNKRGHKQMAKILREIHDGRQQRTSGSDKSQELRITLDPANVC